ncbi:hypothetical protein ACP70R_024535 [Stipagrostis hirtigluma subsp. patula]
MDIGWPGSAHDSRVFNDTLSRYSDEFPHPPEGKYYLVDSGYPNKKGFLAPYKGQKYHVPDFQRGHIILFERCDEDEDYIPEDEDYIPPVASSGGGEYNGVAIDDGDMCAFRDFIADSLMAARE